MTNQPLIITEDLSIEPVYQKFAVHLFLTIIRQWKISESDAFTLTGLGGWNTYLKWQQKIIEPMSADIYMRLSMIIEINKCLRAIEANPSHSIEWLDSLSIDFGRLSPMQHMLSHGPSGMHDVHKHLYFKAY